MKNKINPAELLNSKYHPSKGTSSESDGIFRSYVFKDGSSLRVRKMFEQKLFRPRWRRLKRLAGKPLWKMHGELPASGENTPATVHQTGNLKIVVRQLEGRRIFRDRHVQERLSEILKRKLRIESPLFELQIPSQNKYLVGTRFVEGEELEKVMARSNPEERSGYVRQMADTMAKLHVNALSHGHMHARNFILRNKRLVLVDSKYIVKMPRIFTPEEVEAAALRAPSLLHPMAALFFQYMPVISPISLEMSIAIKDLRHEEGTEFIKRYIESYRKLYNKK